MALRVLVVDNNPEPCTFLESFLKSRGADAITCDFSGDIAALVRRVQPDVVLLELLSEGERANGLTILGQLYGSAQTAPLPPILLMSADQVWLSALEARMQKMGIGLVPKPFDMDRLWQAIEQAAQPDPSGPLPNRSAQRS